MEFGEQDDEEEGLNRYQERDLEFGRQEESSVIDFKQYQSESILQEKVMKSEASSEDKLLSGYLREQVKEQIYKYITGSKLS
jgi:hypothetical protein